jgi:hypothetical protein
MLGPQPNPVNSLISQGIQPGERARAATNRVAQRVGAAIEIPFYSNGFKTAFI